LLEDQTTLDKVNRILVDNYIMSKNRGWDPHLILDHHKYVLRQTLLNEGRLKRIKEKSIYERSCHEIDTLKHALNLELEKITIADAFVDLDRVNSLKQAIELAEAPINELKEIETKRLIFRSKAKWSEEGEKSTKYFLNLLKDRQKKMQIRKIISNGVTFYKQDEISKAISNFYRDLYKKQKDLKPVHKDDELLKNLPKLNEQEKTDISKPITLIELYSTLCSCQESAPGPDGISYNIYKKTWECSGGIILDAWNHSINIGQTSQSQREAVITLLEKKEKISQFWQI